nr:recombinase family protein [Bacteroides intestinalis]
MKKFVAYYRVSTKRQNLGLEAQRTSVLNYIRTDNTNILIEEYSEKESGKDDNRNELQKAINCCKNNNATLIIAKLDRLSRKVSFIFSLRDSGVNFIALDVPNFNTLTLGIFATLAQTERELISLRTKNALAEKKAKGIKLGAPNPQFTDEMRKKAYKAHSAVAEANSNNKKAATMISLLIKDNNATQIAKKLNENNFVTSRGNKFTTIQVIRLIQRYNLK